jgi:hypothetical protein
MSYEVYKIMHLVALVFMVACLGVNFFSETPRKIARIGGMVASLILMVAGMGLLARTGLGWPSWVIAKMCIWLILAVSAPIMARKLKEKKSLGFTSVLVLITVAIFLAVIKP